MRKYLYYFSCAGLYKDSIISFLFSLALLTTFNVSTECKSCLCPEDMKLKPHDCLDRENSEYLLVIQVTNSHF